MKKVINKAGISTYYSYEIHATTGIVNKQNVPIITVYKKESTCKLQFNLITGELISGKETASEEDISYIEYYLKDNVHGNKIKSEAGLRQRVYFSEECYYDYMDHFLYGAHGSSKHPVVNNRINFTKYEQRIVELLTQNAGYTCSYDEISQAAAEDDMDRNTIHQHIHSIRYYYDIKVIKPLILTKNNGYLYNGNAPVWFIKNNESNQLTPAPDSINQMRSNISNTLFPGNPQHHFSFNRHTEISNEIYTERSGITNQINESLKQNDKILTIIGSPGTGKSEYLIHYIKRNTEIVWANFFCKWNSRDKSNPLFLIREIAYQIAQKNDEFCIALYNHLQNIFIDELMNMDMEQLFRFLFVMPLSQLILDKKQIIVIDAIDELKDNDIFLRILNDYIYDFPRNLVFLISLRHNCLQHYYKHYFKEISIDNSVDNIDIMTYIKTRLNSFHLKDFQIEAISKQCYNNFLYAKHLCDDFIQKQKITLDMFPDNLDNIYYQYFERIFEDKNEYSMSYRVALCVLSAFPEGLSFYQLQAILNWDEKDTINFINKMESLIDATIFPDKIVFYHKSLYDWLLAIELSGKFYVDIQTGIDIIFNYIYGIYCSGLNDLPYVFMRNWRYYGAQSTQKQQYQKMQEDMDFVLWTAGEYRRHSDFETALSTVNSIIKLSNPSDLINFRAQLILNDIYIDLMDERKFNHLTYLIDIRNSISSCDAYNTIHLLENAGWIYMLNKDYSSAKEYFLNALDEYKNIPLGKEKKIKYAHTLYLYSVLLYRTQKYDSCLKELILSQKFIEDVEGSSRSFSYSLGLKLLAWTKRKNKNYISAEKDFQQALTIQNSIYPESNSSIYVAHTLMCLAENEYDIYQQDNNTHFKTLAVSNIHRAQEYYSKYDDRYLPMLAKLSQLEETINEHKKNK